MEGVPFMISEKFACASEGVSFNLPLPLSFDDDDGPPPLFRGLLLQRAAPLPCFRVNTESGPHRKEVRGVVLVVTTWLSPERGTKCMAGLVEGVVQQVGCASASRGCVPTTTRC